MLDWGHKVVKSTCIVLSVASTYNTKRCTAFNEERIWCTSLLVAEGAVSLAKTKMISSPPDNGTIYAAGLLHNLGLLWLADNFPEITSDALLFASENEEVSVRQAMRTLIGTDYCEVGGLLGRSWNLSETLVDAMEHHRDPSSYDSHHQCTTLIGCAAQMAYLLYRGNETFYAADEMRHLVEDSVANDIYQVLRENFRTTRELVRTMISIQ